MTVTLNGEARLIRHSATIQELVEELTLIPQTLLIEHNGLALNRAEWNFHVLREGDKIEFIRVVAGG